MLSTESDSSMPVEIHCRAEKPRVTKAFMAGDGMLVARSIRAVYGPRPSAV